MGISLKTERGVLLDQGRTFKSGAYLYRSMYLTCFGSLPRSQVYTYTYIFIMKQDGHKIKTYIHILYIIYHIYIEYKIKPRTLMDFRGKPFLGFALDV